MTRRTSIPARIAVTVLVLYWGTLFVATHLPEPSLPIHHLNHADLLLHFAAYAILGMLLAYTTSFRWPLEWVSMLWMTAILAIYGVLDESLQYLVPGRYADVRDCVADVLGAMVGLFTIRKVLSLRKKT